MRGTNPKILNNGDKHWYLNGKRHRVDGPAIEYADGDRSWYLYGERHREDGPAVVYPDGTKHWYLDGKEYTEEEFGIEIHRYKIFRNLLRY